ncbi:hypothetical protein B0H14DRAFT_2589098 [Mycena olivaceomarginata]|nr:hypothetical protein B0H14DRAFT_2589098 [Mycena olivaceomarginata]
MACGGHCTVALAADSGRELHRVEVAVDKACKGCDDIVLTFGDCAHMAEKNRLICDNVESVGLWDGHPLADAEVEEVIVAIQTGVDGGEEKGGKVGKVDGRPHHCPASNVLDNGHAGLATVDPRDQRDTPASAMGEAVSAWPGAPLPPAVGRDIGAAVHVGGGMGLGRRRRHQQDRHREFGRGKWSGVLLGGIARVHTELPELVAGKGQEEEKGETKKHDRTYSNVVFAFVGSILTLARSGQKVGAKQLRTDDHHCVVVHEKRHRIGWGIAKEKVGVVVVGEEEEGMDVCLFKLRQLQLGGSNW